MRIEDTFLGTLLCVLGLAVIWHVTNFPRIPGQNYGPGLFPTVIGYGLVLCGAALAFRGLRRKAGLISMPPMGQRISLSGAARAALHVGLSIGAIVLFSDQIGTQLLILAILLSGFLMLGTTPIWSVGLALTLAVVFDVVFRVLLRVPLPTGLLQGWL